MTKHAKSTPPPADDGASLANETPLDREAVPIPAGVLGQRRASESSKRDTRRYGPRVEFVMFDRNRPKCSKCGRRPECNEPFWRDPDPPWPVTCNPCSMQAGGEDAMVELGYKPRPKPYDPTSHQGGLHRWPLAVGGVGTVSPSGEITLERLTEVSLVARPLDLAEGDGLHGSPEEP